MQHHRLGYPEVIRAIVHNLPAEPVRPRLVTPTSPARLTRHEEGARFAKDMDETDKLVAPAVVVRMQDPPYAPQDFGFAYVDSKGHQGEVIPKRPKSRVYTVTLKGPGINWSASPIVGIDALVPSADAPVEWQWPKQAAEPTEWQSGPPPSRGWFSVQDGYDRACGYKGFIRYWNGATWSSECCDEDTLDRKRCALNWPLNPDPRDGIDHDIHWRGPRLVGADWPEPAAPAAKEVPSAEDVRIAADAVQHKGGHRRNEHVLLCLNDEFGIRYSMACPPNRRAEFIRRCNELR